MESLIFAFQRRKRIQKSLGIRMHRIFKNVFDPSDLHKFSRIHHRYFIARGSHNRHIVGNHNPRHIHLFLHLYYFLENLSLGNNIKCCRRLVEDNQLWFMQQTNRNRYPLQHPTRHLVWIKPVNPFWKIDQFQKIDHPLFNFFPGRLRFMDMIDIFHLPADSVNRTKCVHCFLEHNRNLFPAQLIHLFRCHLN